MNEQYKSINILYVSLTASTIYSVMRELIHVIVEDPSECITTASAIVKEKVLNTAKSLIQYISGTSYKGLLAPYFVRVIIFQCGIKAKIISSSFLKDFR